MKYKLPLFVLGAVVVIGGGLYVATVIKSSTKPTVASLPTAATPDSRNQLRTIAIKQLSSAIDAYIADKGSLPIKLSTAPKAICSSISATCAKAKLVDLNFLSATGVYINSIPSDPVGGRAQYSTGFLIAKDATTGKIVVTAPNAELGAVLSASTR
jgi:hypothetical protein